MVSWQVVVAFVALASCAPDPFGVDCRTSPSCQRREDKKRRAAEEDKAETCKAKGMAWVSGADLHAEKFPAALGCTLEKNACSGMEGCRDRSMACVANYQSEAPYCIDSEDAWAGTCVECGDRALMVKQKEASMATIIADIAEQARQRAEEEVRTNKCHPQSEQSEEAIMSSLVRHSQLESVEGGTFVAGASTKFAVHPAKTGRNVLLVVSKVPISIEGPKTPPTDKYVDPDFPEFLMVRIAVSIANGATQTWIVHTSGCVTWSLVSGSSIRSRRMWKGWCAIAVLASGCGRISFDPISDGDVASDTTSDTTSDGPGPLCAAHR